MKNFLRVDNGETLEDLSRGMGQGLHWFPEHFSLSRLAAVMVGMANGEGGVVLIGLAPRSNQVTGVSDAPETADRIIQAALLCDPPLILPMPRLVDLPAGQVLRQQIPAGLPQVYSLEGRYLERENTQTNPMPARRLRQLLMERGVVQFEAQVPPGAALVDLEPSKIEAYLNGLGISAESLQSGWQQYLLPRGCLKGQAQGLAPTYAALLLFGKTPQRWLPNATILAVRFPGVSYGDAFIKQEIAGTLPEQLRQAEAFMLSNLRRRVQLVGLERQEMLEYPAHAVRELLVNAVAHRDYNQGGDMIHLNIYSDRLEVISPGKLPGPVNLENLLEARFSRNAVLVQLLADMGFIERLGYGLNRVVTLMRQAGLRPPRFEENGGTFKVTLWGESSDQQPPLDLSAYTALGLNPRQQMALEFLARQRRISSREFQELCPDVHAETLRRDLADLVGRGILLKVGDKRATYYILK